MGLKRRLTATEHEIAVDVYWESSNSSIAKIDRVTGWVKGLKEGTVAITATTEKGLGSLVLTVTPAASQLLDQRVEPIDRAGATAAIRRRRGLL